MQRVISNVSYFVVVLDQGSSFDGNSRWELLLWLGSENVLLNHVSFSMLGKVKNNLFSYKLNETKFEFFK